MATSGELKIQIIEARLENDTAWVGQMDPYILVETRMQRFRTQTMNKAGKEP